MKQLWLILACCSAFASSLEALQASDASLQPDIYLVTIDTLRSDHVHCYGYEKIKTPAIDALAKDGIRFTQAFTPSPITNSSHTSILTGLLPSTHGVTDFAIPLAKSHATWAELLKSRGYHTAAFIGAVILDSKTLAPGLDRGFDFYDNFPEHAPTNAHWGRVERRGRYVVRRAENWLNANPQGPHFVWIHLYDPHDPYEPPAPYSQIYKDHLYDGEIAYADSALGNFLAYLKQRGRYNRAVVVLVGDHGEGLGEHHEQTHGIFLYDSTTHVPLILKMPNLAKRSVVEEQVRTIDILPTVLDLLDMDPTSNRHFDGQSLRPLFTGKESAERTVLAETDYPLRFGWAPLRSVRSGGFKFIEAPKPELYDLGADAGELANKYQPWDVNVQQFRKKLANIRVQTTPSAPPASAVGTGTLEELRALGYLGPGDALSSTNVPEPSLLPDPKDKVEEQNLLHSAMMAADEGRSNDARHALEKVLEFDPSSPTALRQLGEQELHEGRYTTAADHFKRARAVRPEDSAAAFYEGEAWERAGNLAAARDALEASVKSAPGQFDARLLLGKVYLGLKNPVAAEDQLEAALLLRPANKDAILNLARAEIEEGKFAEAVTRLQAAEKSQGGNPEFLELLAQAYSGSGAKAKAEEANRQANAIRRKK